MKKYFWIAALAGICMIPATVKAATDRVTEVRIFDAAKLTPEPSWTAFHSDYKGGASVAVGDINGDGVKEIIAGVGIEAEPAVRIFNGQGKLLSQFLAYPKSLKSGVKVASCDFDKDGKAEIVTGTGVGAAPQVRVFNADGTVKYTPGFFAYDKTGRGGVNISCGDVNGDSWPEIVTGSGQGLSPVIKIFDRGGKSLNLDIVPFADRDRGGVDVAVGNIDGGTESEIVTSIYRFGRSLVKTYKADARRTIIGSFEGWPETVQSGYQVATGDMDQDGYDEILVAVAAGSAPHVRTFEVNGRTLSQNFFPFEKDFRGGVYLAVGDVNGDGRQEIVATSGVNTTLGRKYYQKYIEVSLSEQRLYAYESGAVKKTFLVSTGIKKYPTPTGTFAVRSKIPNKDYEWSYGPNHPDNYDLKDVKNNLNFSGNYFLHEAYWHHNFGHVMSHGCININTANSKWLYDWAEVGTPVIVKQ